MGGRDPFDVLSHLLEQYDQRGWPVGSVSATTDAADGAPLDVTIDVPVSPSSTDGAPDGPLVASTATVVEGGRLRIEYSATDGAVPGSDDPAVTTIDRSARCAEEGVVLTVDLRIDPSGESSTVTSDDVHTVGEPTDSVIPASAVRDEDVPPYEDTAYLERLYEACDTFAEMSRSIEMDVAAETVRRYMIEAGIHDPDSYDTAVSERRDTRVAHESSENGHEDQLVTDGLGLPHDVEATTLVDAVTDARTVYEVQRRLDLDRRRTRELLADFDLLDLVRRRVGEDPDRTVSAATVADRIRDRTLEATSHAPTGPDR